MRKITIVQTTILTAILFLNSGCFVGFNDTPTLAIKQPTPQREVIRQTVPQPPIVAPVTQQVQATIPPPLSTLPVECTDDISSPNSCQKEPISPQELKPRQITNQGGEVHKLKSIQGKSVIIVERRNGFKFPQHPNKVVILQMFGKNCPHCMKEMPVMGKIYKKYRKNLEIVAIQVEDRMSAREAKNLIRRHRIKYAIIPGEDATNLQYNIQSTYGWTGILPYTLVIQNGVTEFTYPGEVSYRELNHDIRSLLQ